MMNEKLQYTHDDVNAYDRLMNTSRVLTYKRQVEQLLRPRLSGQHVLELGCGSGYFTWDLAKWGAESVTAVDLSSNMIALAQQNSASNELKNVKFIVSDCMTPCRFRDEEYDVVFVAWMMEHAGSGDELRGMTQCVSFNLKPGGVFVCVSMPPSRDPEQYMEGESRVRPMSDEKWIALLKSWECVPDGVSAQFIFHTDDPAHDVVMDQYHLRKDVIEGEIRGAGITRSIEWIPQAVPSNLSEYDAGEVVGGRAVAEWKAVMELPEFAILLAVK